MARRRHLFPRAVAGIAAFCHRRPGSVVTFSLLFTLLCLSYISTHMAVSTDFNALLSDKLPFARNHAALERAFPRRTDTVLAVIDADQADLSDYAARRLVSWLRGHPEAATEVFDPVQDPFFRRNGLLYQSLEDLQKTAADLSAAQPFLTRLAMHPNMVGLSSLLRDALTGNDIPPSSVAVLERFLDACRKALDAARKKRFFVFPWSALLGGSEETRRLIEITPHLHPVALQPAGAAIERIQGAIRDLDLTPERGIRIRLTGGAMLDYVQLQSSMRAAGWASALTGILVLALLLTALKDLHLLFAVVLTLGMSFIWTTAFALAATAPLNLISISFAVLFIGMGVDFGIQFGSHYRFERTLGAGPARAVRRTAAWLGSAMSLSAAAAAGGFLSFTPTAYKGLADLGIIAGGGMALALVATLTVLPALLGLMRASARRRIPSGISTWTWPYKHGRAIVAATAILAAAAVQPALHLHFDFNPLHLLDPDLPAVRAFKDLARQSRASPYAIQILARNLVAADRLAAELRHLPVVARVLTLSSFVPKHQDEKLAVIEDLEMIMPPVTLAVENRFPSGRETFTALARLRQTLLSYARAHPHSELRPPVLHLAASIPPFLAAAKADPAIARRIDQLVFQGFKRVIEDLATALEAHRIDIGSLPDPLKRRYLGLNGQSLIEVYSGLDLDRPKAMERFVREVQRLAPTASGDPVMMVEGGRTVARSFLQATTLAFIFVVVLLLAALRSARDCVGVLVPLAVAALLTAAAMRLVGLPLNLANVIVMPLLAGLGVSYGIYLALRQRAHGVQGLFESATPRAVLFSALTTLCSFGSLAVSGNRAMSYLGATLSLALAVVLACVFLVQPALMLVLGRSGGGH